MTHEPFRKSFGHTSTVTTMALVSAGLWLSAALPACSDSGDDQGDHDAGTDAGDASLSDGHTNSDGQVEGDGSTDGSVPPSGCWNEVPELGQVTFWVSPAGDDSNPGTEDAPFATLAKATQAVRDLLAGTTPETEVVVVLREGTYHIEETLQLGSDDSGPSDQAPVLWRSYPDEKVVLSGTTALQASWFTEVPTDDPLYDRIQEQVRSQVRVVSLADHGITDYGTLHRRGMSTTNQWGLELLVDSRPAELAGWPNRGQTDPFDENRPALVKGDIFGTDGTAFQPIGTQASGNADDGYPNYQADVDGTTYYLYHCTWFYGEILNRYWWVSTADPRTDPQCWPSGLTAWGASGTDPIPKLRALFGGSHGELHVSNRPEDFALHGFAWLPKAYSDSEFQLPGTRWQNWTEAEDPWFWGLFGRLWADATLSGVIDDTGRVTLDEASNYGIADMHPFRVINLIEELDSPGEYYLDRATGHLYYIPKNDLSQSDLAVTMIEGPQLSLDGVSHVHFEGITFLGSRGRLVQAMNVTDVTFSRCQFLGAAGLAVQIRGSDSGLACSKVWDSGGYAVVLDGGHRATLEAGNSFVRDCDIGWFGRLDRTYHVGVRVNGCGQIIEHNYLHDSPHSAILFSGNNHLFAYNDIARVVLEASDAGAIYTGRDWGYRGNLIQYNWIHDIGEAFLGGIHAVYLDDASSGIDVFGNIITNIRGTGTMSGGGRDNHFENNVIVHIEGAAHHTDRRARTSNHDFNGNVPDSWNLLGRLHYNFSGYERGVELFYQQDPWASAYPDLAAIPDDWNQVHDSHWQDPEGCSFSRNIIYDAEGFIHEGTWGGENALDSYADVTDNLEDQDPLFVDEDNGDLNLRPDSPAFSIPGFEAIPFDEIGPR